MYKNILIATDESELAQKAVAQGLALAKVLGAKVTAVTVTEPWATMAPPEVLERAFCSGVRAGGARASKAHSGWRGAAAKEASVACATLHVTDRFPAEGILEAATNIGADLIVMASHGRRGLAKFLLGSQATEVLTHSTVPVLICR